MGGRLEGRVALVTGGSRGIGAAIAEAFAAEGATVVIVSRKAEALEQAAAAIEARGVSGRVIPRAAHVGHTDAIPALFEEVVDRVGAPDVLVNNAGTNPYFGPMLGLEWSAWEKTFEVNLKGPFEMIRQFAQRGFEAGRGGSVIQVASIVGHTAAPLQGIYGMTKAALISMTKTLAVELGEAGIRINALAPGVVDTRLAGVLVKDPVIKARIEERTALKRVAQPREMAGIAVYLASDESSYVTGQTFFVDGGYTAS